MRASLHGHTKIVRLLLEAGASVNNQNERGETALMFASEYGHTEIVKLLEVWISYIGSDSLIKVCFMKIINTHVLDDCTLVANDQGSLGIYNNDNIEIIPKDLSWIFIELGYI